MKLKEICTKYVSFLRALYLLHQNHHWLTCGPNFYGNHLLFERLYKSAQENVDLAAEKFIGLFGYEMLGVAEQSGLMHELLDKYTGTDFVKSSFEAEKDFLEFSKVVYEELGKQDKLSLGLDDMIMSIASDREGSVYLLKQILGDDMNKLSSLAKKFQVKLAQAAEIVDETAQLRQKLNNMLTVNLANKNWGEAGFNSLSVTKKDGFTTITCNFIIPSDSPPFMDKHKYPQGLNQFKQEMMTLMGQIAENMGIDQLVQIVQVNGQ